MWNRLMRAISYKYDPVQYWNERTNPNGVQGLLPEQIAYDVKYISTGLSDCKKVFELGPGVGRTMAAYKPGTRLFSLDISVKYRGQLEAVARDKRITLIQKHARSLNLDFPFEDGEFGVSVCSQVLMHVPPSQIHHAAQELLRVSKRVVVISTFLPAAPERTVAPHVFNHDYLSIFSGLGCFLDSLMVNHGRIYFYASRRLR